MSDSGSLDGVDFGRVTRHADSRVVEEERRSPRSFFNEHRLGRERYGAPARIAGRRYGDDQSEDELGPPVPRIIEPGRQVRRRGSMDAIDRERVLAKLDVPESYRRSRSSVQRRRRHLDPEIDEDLLFAERFRRLQAREDGDLILVDRSRGRSGCKYRNRILLLHPYSRELEHEQFALATDDFTNSERTHKNRAISQSRQ
jgi:hypothetical protein